MVKNTNEDVMARVFNRAEREDKYSGRLSYDEVFSSQLTLNGKYRLSIDPEQVDRVPKEGLLDVVIYSNEGDASQLANYLSLALDETRREPLPLASVLNSRSVKAEGGETILSLDLDRSFFKKTKQTKFSSRAVVASSIYLDAIRLIIDTIDKFYDSN
ncbi:hypothetical protein CMI45_02215 [Candidatus Pacearchaeota archaeon]|nr:hypothetical protein [Candidatus Pacearchaeota archaeon]|tara:strand:+ start:2712 stop:3185 length:474 start_codon:yes stop_codon:yes gene_type:complete